jgi:hypothetical protein
LSRKGGGFKGVVTRPGKGGSYHGNKSPFLGRQRVCLEPFGGDVFRYRDLPP